MYLTKCDQYTELALNLKKLYWPFFRFCLNVSVVNLWMLYWKVENISPIEIIRQIVISLLSGSDLTTKRGVKPGSRTQVLNTV